MKPTHDTALYAMQQLDVHTWLSHRTLTSSHRCTNLAHICARIRTRTHAHAHTHGRTDATTQLLLHMPQNIGGDPADVIFHRYTRPRLNVVPDSRHRNTCLANLHAIADKLMIGEEYIGKLCKGHPRRSRRAGSGSDKVALMCDIIWGGSCAQHVEVRRVAGQASWDLGCMHA